jgi:hypothetical protein
MVKYCVSLPKIGQCGKRHFSMLLIGKKLRQAILQGILTGYIKSFKLYMPSGSEIPFSRNYAIVTTELGAKT